jgi:hypothetical protein
MQSVPEFASVRAMPEQTKVAACRFSNPITMSALMSYASPTHARKYSRNNPRDVDIGGTKIF